MNPTVVDPPALTPSGGTTRPLPHVDGVRHRFLQTSRLRVHVAEAGEGEPVLLLHGWPQHWYAWRKIIPLLAQSHRLICPDLRGFGWTDAPQAGYGTAQLSDDLLALLDTLDLDRVLVVGHEIGGRLGFHLALRAPSRVRRLVTLNAMHPYWSAGRLAPHAWRSWWTVFVETPLIGRTVLRRIPAFTRMLFRLGSPDRATRSAPAVDEYIAALREPARARAAERVQGQFAYREIVPTLLGKHKSTRLEVPTLMLNGTKDFALAPAELGGYEPYTRDLRVELIAGAGHFLHEQHPQLVADTALRFFAPSRASVPDPTFGSRSRSIADGPDSRTRT
jgi:pimeloyl-ACP methyl ester carboxylesterase